MLELGENIFEVKDKMLSGNYHWEKASSFPKMSDDMEDLTSQVLIQLEPNIKNLKNREDIIYLVEVFIYEIYSNALLHGNFGETGSKEEAIKRAAEKYQINSKIYDEMRVKVSLEINLARFKISIEDEGRGFDKDKVPDPKKPENLLQTSGKGLSVIEGLAKEYGFESPGIQDLSKSGNPNEGKHGTRVSLEYRFGKKQAA